METQNEYNFPLISVIVPCYNQAGYLDECLQSVQEQTFSNWECIIINDGSPDDTERVAKEWAEKDNRFKYVQKENGGVASARNYGIENANGTWILPLDGDDKIGRDYLHLAAQEFPLNPHIVYCKAEYFGAKTGEIALGEFTQAVMLIENQIFCSAFFKKKSWSALKGYDEKMTAGYEDWEFWLRFLEIEDLMVKRLDYVGFYYRIKELSRNTVATTDKDYGIREYIFRKHPNLFFKNIMSLEKYYRKHKYLEAENKKLKTILKGKRYQFVNKILSILKR